MTTSGSSSNEHSTHSSLIKTSSKCSHTGEASQIPQLQYQVMLSVGGDDIAIASI